MEVKTIRYGCRVRGLSLCAIVLYAGCGNSQSVNSQVLGPASIQFADAINYPTGGATINGSGGPGPAPQGTVAADFDRDGSPDVVIVDPNSRSLIFLKNRGDGSFDSGVRILVDKQISSVASADFNRDGRLDLVGATGTEVVVMLGAGDGTFAVSEIFSANTAAQIQAIAFDADRDQLPDIVMVSHGGVRVFLGQGDGTFLAGPFTNLLREAAALTEANFDTDGVPDLAIVDFGTQEAVALRGVGDGSFEELGSSLIGVGPEAVVAGDFDGDGLSDLASVESFSNTMSVLLSDRTGGFRSVTSHPAGNTPVSLVLADFNGDGRMDIASSASVDAQLVVFTNDGAGNFTEAGRFDVADFPQTPVAADFDKDGRVDLAAGGSTAELSALLNRTGS